MTTKFMAEIKKLECKTGVDGELHGRIILDFIPYDNTFLLIKSMYSPQTSIEVTFSNASTIVEERPV